MAVVRWEEEVGEKMAHTRAYALVHPPTWLNSGLLFTYLTPTLVSELSSVTASLRKPSLLTPFSNTFTLALEYSLILQSLFSVLILHAFLSVFK